MDVCKDKPLLGEEIAHAQPQSSWPRSPPILQEGFRTKMAANSHVALRLCCASLEARVSSEASSASSTRWRPASCSNGLAIFYLSSEYVYKRIRTCVSTRGIPLLLARSATCFSTHRINAWTPAKSRATLVQAHLVLREGPEVLIHVSSDAILFVAFEASLKHSR